MNASAELDMPGLARSSGDFSRDLAAGLVVFLVALPLCLGVALASNAPLLSGVLAGIIGGILVGSISGSHSSVSGPAAGLTAVVAAEIASLGSFPAFLLAVSLAGLIQILLGLLRAGSIAGFFPTSVIKGLLAAIGVILVLKQIPHVLGHDSDPEGDMAFAQLDHENTFSELIRLIGDIHPGAAAIGLISLAVLYYWEHDKRLKSLRIPAPLGVVVLGVLACLVLSRFGEAWSLGPSHLVQVPTAGSPVGFLTFLQSPDFSQWLNPAIYTAALTIAAVASLETLLNLEAIDKIDPHQRNSPPNRELLAQGMGNLVAGLVGGIPVTSVIVRSSVNINAGGRTKHATIVHGVLLLVSVVFLPRLLNQIPLASLAAILLLTGAKLASPALVRQMWNQGRSQFLPFAATVVAIVLTDLLIGIVIGLVVSVGFILRSNMRRPIRQFVEQHLGCEVVHIELANQVSFLNRGILLRALDAIPRGGHVLLNAQNTDYIDPDVLDLLQDFAEQTGPARGVTVSLLGFPSEYKVLRDQIRYVDHSTQELQSAVTPAEVLRILKDGNERFRSGRHLTRDFGRQLSATAAAPYPLAVVLGCIDARTPVELIFDVGLGDLFSVRIAGNVTCRKILGSVEYACAVAGSRLILVMGHTRCGAVTAAVNQLVAARPIAESTGCEHLGHIVDDIQEAVAVARAGAAADPAGDGREAFINAVSRQNVSRVMRRIRAESRTIDHLAREGRVAIVGAFYDVQTGGIEFLPDEPAEAPDADAAQAEATGGPEDLVPQSLS